MPLAPQITNTPIPYSTWFVSGDYDNSATAVVTPSATYTLAYPGPSAVNIGDIWFDTSNGNHQYRWDGSNWIDVQDGSIASAATLAGTANSTANTALSTANTANTNASSALSTANTANSTANSAYTKAASAVQTSANTIVNASNQLTAINAGGITVYSGTSSSSGARVVMNSAGIAAYNSGGTATFSLDASTGNASFIGTITSTSGSVGGWSLSSNYLIAGSTYLYTDSGSATYAMITNKSVHATSGFESGSGSYQANLIGSSVSSGPGWSMSGTPIPAIATGSGYDALYSLGSSSFRWNYVYSAHASIQTSDERSKNTIEPTSLGLNFINLLKPVSFKMNQGTVKRVTNANNEIEPEIVPGTRTHFGFIAQDVKTALTSVGIDPSTAAIWTLDDPSDPDSRQGLVYDYFISPLVKAVQELSAEVEKLKGAANGTASS